MSKRKNRGKKTTKSKSGKNRSSINEHTRKKNELIPPLGRITEYVNMSFSSWMNDRLPEMLWAVILRTAFNQNEALGLFRRLLNFIAKHKSRELMADITLTGLSKLDKKLRSEVIAYIIELPAAAAALSCLRVFESLPARKDWDNLLPDISPDINLLMQAVGSTLWHQSQESTDCRWLRVMGNLMAGKLILPSEMLGELINYPNVDDLGMTCTSIRAMEITPTSVEPPDLTWAKAFWAEAWDKMPCLVLSSSPSITISSPCVTIQRIHDVKKLLMKHWQVTHTTTEIDAKHDAVFGMADYALRILEELMNVGAGTSIIGRLGIRTIFEVHVNLRYLLMKADPALWKKWREYGAGQAKLNALKFDDDLEPPKYIDIDSIEQISGEDMWEEFSSINLAGWSGLDLRKLSERSNLKAEYDKHYSWTSGYAHGAWGAIRESCFQTCGNPLHRLHRYPDHKVLNDVVSEAALLVDEVLNDLHSAYSPFYDRLCLKNKSEG